MQLIYKIEFNTTNQYFNHIIEDLIKEAKVNATCKQYKGFILLTLDEEPEVIESFFATLGNKLPVSIFMGNSYVVDSIDDSLEELQEFDIKQNLSLLTNDAIKQIIDENQIDFLNDIVKISKGGVSRFETHNGLKDLFLPNKELREEFENKGYEVGITSLGNPDTIAPAVQKGNKELLDFINKDIKKLGKENFFHKDYEKTLRPTYGDAAKADDLVVEGGEVK